MEHATVQHRSQSVPHCRIWATLVENPVSPSDRSMAFRWFQAACLHKILSTASLHRLLAEKLTLLDVSSMSVQELDTFWPCFMLAFRTVCPAHMLSLYRVGCGDGLSSQPWESALLSSSAPYLWHWLSMHDLAGLHLLFLGHQQIFIGSVRIYFWLAGGHGRGQAEPAAHSVA